MAGALGPEATLDKQIQTDSEQTMHLHFSKVRYILLVSLAALLLAMLVATPRGLAQTQAANESSLAQISPPRARITQPIDNTQLARLKGNVHPLARPEFDLGPVEDWQPMNRMLLLLQRSPEQETALQQLLAEQQAKDSPNFHRWLTPQQFGAQFGPADADIQAMTDWLTSQGFHGIKVSAGRTAIEFSGNVGQVQNTFHTEIHRYLVNGEARQANSSDPQIPVALAPVVAGVVSLHNFPLQSMKRSAGTMVAKKESTTSPLFTTNTGCGPAPDFALPCYAVGPADFAKIYSLPPTATLNGTGATIGIVAGSNINPQDVAAFRALFGLSSNFTASNITVDGQDPGLDVGRGELEADLDVQVAGMVAPGATVKLVVSESTLSTHGPDLSALYLVDNNIADIISESFGLCESALGTTGNQFYNTLWEQASAQGITVVVAAGDSGPAGCDDPSLESVATGPLSANGIASTPFDVAVGGTDFDDVGRQTSFWGNSAANAPVTRESALGYIPEMAWNDSCGSTATSANLNTVCALTSPNPLLNIGAGGGGASAVYAKPSWQSGTITPADAHRDLPDVSLFASDGPQTDSFYLVCEADVPPPPGTTPPPSCATTGSFSFQAAGGTSASAPAFAGIMALINQQQKAITPTLGGRQGNANPVLYTIAKAETFASCNSSTMPLTGSATCVFYDVTKAGDSTSVPCAGASSATCSSQAVGTNGVYVTAGAATTPAFAPAAGYDFSTGLGSMNVTNLAASWKTTAGAFKGSVTSLTLNGGVAPITITHGTAVTAAGTVGPAVAGTTQPTGDVSLIASAGNVGAGRGTLNGLAPDVANFTTTTLPGGAYTVHAHYAGDGTFAPSDDPTGVPVTVNKEASNLQVGIVTLDSTGHPLMTNAASFVYGSPYILRVDVLNSTGTATNCQPLVAAGVVTGCAQDATGTVTLTDNGKALDGGTFALNGQGNVEDHAIELTGGAHALSANYSGDGSFNPPAAPVTDNVTVVAAGTATSMSPVQGPVPTGTAVTLTANIGSTSSSTKGPTGTVSFFNNGTTLVGAPVAVVPTGASAAGPAGGTASLQLAFGTAGTESITATYSGDSNYATSTTAAPITFAVTNNASFSISAATTAVAAGSTAPSTVTVTPSGGFTGTVNVSCNSTTLPPGVTCSPASVAVNVINTNPATGNLTLAVAAPSSSTSASLLPAEQKFRWAGLAPTLTISNPGSNGLWGFSAITGLAAVLLLLLPGTKRYRTALALGLICVLTFTLGCGGGSTTTGAAPTTTKITVASTKVPQGTVSFTANVTSTGKAPTGSVQLFDGTVRLGTATAISGGSATISIPNLAVGTHAISAQYLGDAFTQASQSGSLNITVTGPTSFTVMASSGTANQSATVTLTIN